MYSVALLPGERVPQQAVERRHKWDTTVSHFAGPSYILITKFASFYIFLLLIPTLGSIVDFCKSWKLSQSSASVDRENKLTRSNVCTQMRAIRQQMVNSKVPVGKQWFILVERGNINLYRRDALYTEAVDLSTYWYSRSASLLPMWVWVMTSGSRCCQREWRCASSQGTRTPRDSFLLATTSRFWRFHFPINNTTLSIVDSC